MPLAVGDLHDDDDVNEILNGRQAELELASIKCSTAHKQYTVGYEWQLAW